MGISGGEAAQTNARTVASIGSKQVLVAGDATLSWNIARLAKDPDPSWVWDPEDRAEIFPQPSGAILLGTLLEAAAGHLQNGLNLEVKGHEGFNLPVAHNDDDYNHSFAVWSLWPQRKGNAQRGVWRIDEFVGIRRCEKRQAVGTSDPPSLQPEMVVIADTDLGFRSHPSGWPKAIKIFPREQTLIVHCMQAPVFRGPLWNRLSRGLDRVIEVVALESLRKSHVALARELSWERTAVELVREARQNPEMRWLERCRHVVVTMGTGGAILLSNPTGRSADLECRVVFDPETIENTWVKSYPGQILGYNTCVTAAVALQILSAPQKPGDRAPVEALIRGIKNGLAASRELHYSGFRNDRRNSDSLEDEQKRAEITFPTKDIAQVIASGKAIKVPVKGEATRSGSGYLKEARNQEDFSVAQMPSQGTPEPDDSWTILDSFYPQGLESVAEAVARLGVEVALRGVPVGRFGEYVTVDRGEIEGFRSVESLICDYARQATGSPPATSKLTESPLSIGAFGPPGAGKSFSMMEVGKAALSDTPYEPLTFNLSQMRDPSDLAHALQRVRDAGLKGKLPFVLWDEFDVKQGADDYGWLRYFLAPMQDGRFQEGDVVRPIGKAVFVFAASRFKTLTQFADELEKRDHLDKKGRDFVSRIKGHVDLVGPDPRDEKPDEDPCYRIRRALFLRSILLRDRPDLFKDVKFKKVTVAKRLEIDSGVLRALLGVKKYHHGARSLETIVRISRLQNRTRFERFALPPKRQLAGHVDAEEFLSLVNKYVPAAAELEVLAIGIQSVRNRGDGAGPNGENHSFIPPFFGSDVEQNSDCETWPYEQLPPYLCEQNLAIARDLPEKLDRLGYVLYTNGPARCPSDREILANKLLGPFLEAEHDSWVKEQQRDGHLGASGLPDPHLQVWQALPDVERQRDERQVLDLLHAVKAAKMAVERVPKRG